MGKSACVVPLPHNNTIVHSLLRISSTRQLTMAPISSSSATSDMQITQWCEHELDYVIFVQGEVDLSAVNEDEVSETLYVSMDEMKEFRKNENVLFTPWFKYICDNFLYKWWEALDSLDDVKDSSIQRAGDQSQI